MKINKTKSKYEKMNRSRDTVPVIEEKKENVQLLKMNLSSYPKRAREAIHLWVSKP